MALKFKVDSLEGIDPALAPHYAHNEQDNKYYLQAEGAVSKEKLDDFRTNNIELMNKLKGYEGIDPKRYKELDRLHKEGNLQDKSKEEIDKLLNDRVSSMREEYESKVSSLSRDIQTKDTQLSVLLIDNVVRDAAIKSGIQGAAIDDVLLRAKTVFRIEDGAPTPYDAKGSVIYGKDGSSPMSVLEWMNSLKKTAPHLFPGSGGSGATGGRTGVVDPTKLSAIQKIQMGLQNRQG